MSVQSNLFDVYVDHNIGQELKAMFDCLDAHPEIVDMVAPDVIKTVPRQTGRKGLGILMNSEDTILNC